MFVAGACLAAAADSCCRVVRPPMRAKRVSSRSFASAEQANEEIIDKDDLNHDGIVDNDEYISGAYGEEPEEAGSDNDWDANRPWSTRDVFAKMESETQNSIVPEGVPSACAEIMEYAVNPNEPWKKIWNTAVLAAVIFSTFVVPFTLAFRPGFEGNVVDYLIDLIFYVDMGLNFFTGAQIAYCVVLLPLH